MTYSEEYRLERLEELKLLRAVLRERDRGPNVRSHGEVRRVQETKAGSQSLVAGDSAEKLTHAEALGRLRSESARAAAHVRPRVSAKSRQQISGEPK